MGGRLEMAEDVLRRAKQPSTQAQPQLEDWCFPWIVPDVMDEVAWMLIYSYGFPQVL